MILAQKCVNGGQWTLNTIQFTDNTVLIAENQSALQKHVNVFDSA